MDLRIKGKYALVTGGASGIGAGCAQVLAEEGCNIIIVDKDEKAASEFTLQITKKYCTKAWAVRADMTKKEDIYRMFEEIEEKIGSIDILINNAGGGWKTPVFQEITDEEWMRSFNLVLHSAFYTSKEFAKQCIKDKKPGVIINILSKSVLMSSSKCNAPYVSSKGGMLSMTRAMAKDLIDYNIRVNGVVPGYVQTEKTYPVSDPNTEVKRKLLPSGEFAKPYDIGNLVAFLSSPRSQQMIGAVVDITGGTLM